MGDEEIQGKDIKTNMEDKNRCWQVLKYTKPRINRIIPALKSPHDKVTVIMYEKKALVRGNAFPKPPKFRNNKYFLGQGSTHLLVNVEIIAKTLFCQSIKEALGVNMHNFCILRLI